MDRQSELQISIQTQKLSKLKNETFEIEFLERLVRDYEERNFRSLNHNEQQEIDDLIETLFLKGVEEK